MRSDALLHRRPPTDIHNTATIYNNVSTFTSWQRRVVELLCGVKVNTSPLFDCIVYGSPELTCFRWVLGPPPIVLLEFCVVRITCVFAEASGHHPSLGLGCFVDPCVHWIGMQTTALAAIQGWGFVFPVSSCQPCLVARHCRKLAPTISSLLAPGISYR